MQLEIAQRSSAAARLAAERPTFIAAVAPAIGGALIPVPAGVLVRAPGEAPGVVGISGGSSENDAAAIAGIEAVGCQADRGA